MKGDKLAHVNYFESLPINYFITWNNHLSPTYQPLNSCKFCHPLVVHFTHFATFTVYNLCCHIRVLFSKNVQLLKHSTIHNRRNFWRIRTNIASNTYLGTKITLKLSCPFLVLSLHDPLLLSVSLLAISISTLYSWEVKNVRNTYTFLGWFHRWSFHYLS